MKLSNFCWNVSKKPILMLVICAFKLIKLKFRFVCQKQCIFSRIELLYNIIHEISLQITRMIWLLVEHGSLAMYSRLEHKDTITRISGYYKEHKLCS